MTPNSSAPSRQPRPTTETASTPPRRLTTADAALAGLEEAARAVRLRTLWPRLERLCRPQSERLWFIGGFPGNYKTQLIWNLAVDMAERGGQRALVVSLEMPPHDMALQALARFSGVPLDRILASHNPEGGVYLSDEEGHRLNNASDRLRKLDLSLRIHGAADGRSLEAVLKAAKAARFDAIFIDHIGMVGRDEAEELRALSLAVDALRGLAKGEDVKGYRPFVCVTSPLNRDGAKKDKNGDDRLPQLSDFRGSSRIESDADFAMIMRKRPKTEGDPAPNIVDGFVLKNRQGECPAVLQFEAQGATCWVNERVPESAQPVTYPAHPQRERPQPRSWHDREDAT